MSGTRRFRLAEGVLAQAVLDEAILLDARAGVYFSANYSASVVLRALLDGMNEDEVLVALRERFDAGDDQLQADLAQCLDDWLRRGLIVVRA